jgi:hypothetical protein
MPASVKGSQEALDIDNTEKTISCMLEIHSHQRLMPDKSRKGTISLH